MEMAQAPFVIQPQLTAITLAYRNQRLIADDVLPRVPVASTVFKWSQYTTADAFTVPDTRVGRKGDVNEIDWTATEQVASTKDYGLEDAIPYSDIANAESARQTHGVYPIDPQARSVELLTELVALDREVRVANLVTNAANYAAANKTTLSGTSQWSDFTNSDPVGAILAAMDSMLIRPNKMVIGRAVYTTLRRHPKIVAAAVMNGGNASVGGVVMKQAIADLLELDDIIIGEGWVNTAKKGQAPSMARVWGKSAALIYQSPVMAAPEGTITYGFTAEWGQRLAGTIEQDPDIGLRGGTRVRVGESVQEVIAANDAGYLFSSAIA
jgi:hypothetical protein